MSWYVTENKTPKNRYSGKITYKHRYIKVFNASGKSADVSGSQDEKHGDDKFFADIN